MIDVVALGELLIDFATVCTDADGYPSMAAPLRKDLDTATKSSGISSVPEYETVLANM